MQFRKLGSCCGLRRQNAVYEQRKILRGVHFDCAKKLNRGLTEAVVRNTGRTVEWHVVLRKSLP